MLECGDTWCSTSTTPAIADLSPNTVMWRTVWCMLNNQNMQSTRGKGRTLQCVVQPGSQSRWNKQSALMCRQQYRACHILAGSCPNIHARVQACQCATVARSMHAFPACDKINGHCTPTRCRTMLKKSCQQHAKEEPALALVQCMPEQHQHCICCNSNSKQQSTGLLNKPFDPGPSTAPSRVRSTPTTTTTTTKAQKPGSCSLVSQGARNYACCCMAHKPPAGAWQWPQLRKVPAVGDNTPATAQTS